MTLFRKILLTVAVVTSISTSAFADSYNEQQSNQQFRQGYGEQRGGGEHFQERKAMIVSRMEHNLHV